jgi:hypothetical protein
MKKIILFFALITGLSLNSQTRIYSANADGTIDKTSYQVYDHSTGKIMVRNKNIPPGNDTVHNVIIRISANKIYTYGKQSHFTQNPKAIITDKEETTTEIGYLTADKKIIHIKNGEAVNEAVAPYIKDNKIYSSDNKVIGFIEGQDIYGAASYLLSL